MLKNPLQGYCSEKGSLIKVMSAQTRSDNEKRSLIMVMSAQTRSDNEKRVIIIVMSAQTRSDNEKKGTHHGNECPNPFG